MPTFAEGNEQRGWAGLLAVPVLATLSFRFLGKLAWLPAVGAGVLTLVAWNFIRSRLPRSLIAQV